MRITPMLTTGTGPRDGDAVLLEDDPGRAAAVMQVVRELIPWDGYSLSAWDAASGSHRHITLASEGYSDSVLVHMNDRFVEDNPGFQLLHTRVPGALRWSDLAEDWQVEFDRTYSAEGVLIPAGFHEGVTMCLRLPGGRYTGALHISWADRRNASDQVRGVIESFQPLLARACDLLANAHSRVHRAGPDAHAVLLQSGGAITEMPGYLPGPHLSDDSAVASFRRHATSARGSRVWIAPTGTCHRIEHIPGPNGSTVLVEREIPRPFGLSARELQILHWIAQGYSNPEIGKALFISPRTVSTHVERILDKLRSSSRAQLVRYALDAEILLIDEPDGPPATGPCS